MKKFQTTIARETSISGIGLHSGAETTVIFRPAPVDTGILFIRDDIPDSPPIPATLEHVVDLKRGTTIGIKDARVMTIEHLLGALTGLEIDNIICHINGPEIPLADGSAMPFVEKLLEAGLEAQDAERKYLVVDEIITYADRSRGIDVHVLPFDGFRLTFMIDYQNPALGTQYTTLDSLEEEFVSEFASARTYCCLSEVTALAEQGLIQGGTLKSALVFVDLDLESEEARKVLKMNLLNEEEYRLSGKLLGQSTMRYYNEPVRHKVVDLLGDLRLVGMPIKAHIIAARSGHAANVEVAKLLRKHADRKQMAAKFQGKKVREGSAFLDIHAVMRMLPHRYPFLFIDRVLEMDPKERIVALKNVTINEPFFSGHFGEHPIMPGVLMLEAMAQAGGLLMLQHIGGAENKVPYFTGLDNVKFRRPVLPGDALQIVVEMKAYRMGIFMLRGEIFVDGQLTAEANFTATTVDK